MRWPSRSQQTDGGFKFQAALLSGILAASVQSSCPGGPGTYDMGWHCIQAGSDGGPSGTAVPNWGARRNGTRGRLAHLVDWAAVPPRYDAGGDRTQERGLHSSDGRVPGGGGYPQVRCTQHFQVHSTSRYIALPGTQLRDGITGDRVQTDVTGGHCHSVVTMTFCSSSKQISHHSPVLVSYSNSSIQVMNCSRLAAVHEKLSRLQALRNIYLVSLFGIISSMP